MNEIVSKLDQLAELKATADATRIDYETKRAEILKVVQTELDALDAEYSPLLTSTDERLAQLETEIREQVLKFGASVRGKSLHAVFYRGRVSWDTKGLQEYAQDHPEVIAFRSEGEPSVQLRIVKPPNRKGTP